MNVRKYAMNSERDNTARDRFIFSETTFRSPLEELEVVREKKIETMKQLGDDKQADLYHRAYELARDRLAEILREH